MTAEREAAVASDSEISEKRTRKELERASISEGEGKEAEAVAEKGGEEVKQGETNGEESHDAEVEAEDASESEDQQAEAAPVEIITRPRMHTRKRSRDSTVDEDELPNGKRQSGEHPRDAEGPGPTSNGTPAAVKSDRESTPEHAGEKRGEAAVEDMASPKFKRSRLQSSLEEKQEETQPPTEESKAPTDGSKSSDASTDAPKSSEEAKAEPKAVTPIPTGSGFANTSALSPFASLAKSQSPVPKETSTSAFAASGFASLSASSTSGFGALGKSSGGFGTGGSFASKSTTETEKAESKTEQKSAFGGALGQTSAFAASPANGEKSAFAAPASGFAKLGEGSAFGGGGGFGSLGGFGSGGGLTSFASGKPSSSFASSAKAPKPFGAPAAADDEEEDEAAGEAQDESGFKSPLSQESDKQDERFYLQSLSTGEEEESTDYTCRAKLYNFVTGDSGKKEWKERGLGVLRLNTKRVEDTKPTARLVMRAEGTQRVILNTPVKKELTFGTPSGRPPQAGYMYFMGAIEGGSGLEMLQVKMRPQFATELYDKIKEVQAEM